MNRLNELLDRKNSYLLDNEMIIYVLNGEMIVKYNDGNKLVEISGQLDDKLYAFINSNFTKDDCNYCRMPYDSEGEPNCSCYLVEDMFDD